MNQEAKRKFRIILVIKFLSFSKKGICPHFFPPLTSNCPDMYVQLQLKVKLSGHNLILETFL